MPIQVQSSVTICDREGNLLFYSDGIKAWNKEHQVIQNAEDLGSDFFTGQGVVVVQSENNENIYHLFTLSNSKFSGKGDMCHSVLDMSANDSRGKVIQQKRLIWTGLTERMIAISNPCGGAWILVHERDNNHFLAFHLENDVLIEHPIVSKVGSKHKYERHHYSNCVGEFSISRSNTLSVLGRGGLIEFLKFDSSSGQLSEPITIKNENDFTDDYSGAFSSNGRFFYKVDSDYPYRKVIQYDLENLSTEAIKRSRIVIDSLRKRLPTQPVSFKLAPDNNIYISAILPYKSLHRIEDPNQDEGAAKFQLEFLTLGDQVVSNALPQDLVKATKREQLSIPDTIVCEDWTIDLTRFQGITTWQDGQESNIRTLQDSGTYNVTVNYGAGCRLQDTFHLDIYPKQIDTTFATIRTGEEYDWRDSIYTEAGLFEDAELDENGCTSRYYLSLNVTGIKDKLFIPTAFSPNADSRNDIFKIYAPPYDKRKVAKFLVFDHWGNQVYRASQNQEIERVGWDGLINGKPAAHGLYTYYIVLETDKGETYNYSGSVVLLR